VVLACAGVNDGDAISCGPTCVEEAICGPVACSCTPTCTAGCAVDPITDNLCYPTASGSYTALCDEGTASGTDTATVTNNEMVPTAVDLTPDGPNMVGDAVPFALACVANFTDGCVYNAVGADLSEGGGCNGSLAGMSYVGSHPPDCDEDVTCTVGGVPDTVTMQNRGCIAMTPGISITWPLDSSGAALRYYGNAHVDQVLTIVYDGTGDDPTAATVTCAGGPAFVCDLSQIAVDPDIPCTPSGAFADLTTYACSVQIDNPCSTDTDSGNLTTAQAAAQPDGGTAAGYVGGLTYDSALPGPGVGPVTITAIDADINQGIPGKVYVQIIQGLVVTERFSDGAGVLTIDLSDAPIDELTVGYKCGMESCAKREDGVSYAQYKTNLARDYQFTTMHDLDASDIVIRMTHMGNALFNRWKLRIQGAVPEAYWSATIAPRPTGIGGMASPTGRRLLGAPVKIRATFVLTTLHGIQAVAAGLDALLLATDYENSISLCILFGDNIDVPVKAALPPNLLIPELRRVDYNAGCQGWATNPGVYGWEYNVWNNGMYENLMSLGVYLNATNFSITGGLDLFAFPLYVTALGFSGITVPGDLTGDPIVPVGNAVGFQYDIREQWNSTPLGYDPDGGVDRKILIAIDDQLPVDPGRRDATLRSGSYRVPNLSDSSLGAGWDTRFYRKNIIVATGADFGVAAGLGVTGLSLSIMIDDPSFTIFAVGYIQSTGSVMGTRNLTYWSGGGGNTDVVSAEHASVSTNWSDPPGTNIDFAPIDTGGPSNYSSIAVLTRGMVTDGLESDPGFSGGGLAFSLDMTFAPGSIVSVWHVGPPEAGGNETIEVNDWLNITEAITPSPDNYIYPAPQWANTLSGSNPANRNGELWYIRTTGADDIIPIDGADPWARRYFEFTRPTMMNASGRTIHMWQLALNWDSTQTGDDGVSTVGMVNEMISVKTKVYSTRGQTDATGTILNDANGTFLTQGVAPGDNLRSQTRKYRGGCGWPAGTSHVITAVNSETQLEVAGGICAGANATNFKYDVARVLPRGECAIDESWGGGPTDYACKANAFWNALGPANSATQTVHVPALTPGPATLNGVTGFIPTFWDNIGGTTEQVYWTRTFLVLSTGVVTEGGLGGPFDYNNWDSKADELTTNHATIDQSKAIYQ